MKLGQRVYLPLLVLVGFSLHCKSSQPSGSQVEEAPDAANQPDRMGLSSLKWDDVANTTSGTLLQKPWSDTYWPLQTHGLSSRWNLPASLKGSIPAYEINLGQYLSQTLKEGSGTKLIHYLSPAEKLDLLQFNRKDEATVTKLIESENSRLVKNSRYPKVQELVQDRDRIYREIKHGYKEKERLQGEINSLANAGDINNQRPALIAEVEDLDKRLTILEDAFDDTSAAIAKQSRGLFADTIVVAEELMPFFPTISNGWKSWATYQNSGSDSWGWMGHCHGWAVAALVEKTPEHAVMAKKGDQEILFTEGDLRGLLTKAWADSPPPGKAKYGAKRCEVAEENLIKDRQGRPIDGMACEGSKECDYKDDGSNEIEIINDNLSSSIGASIQFHYRKDGRSLHGKVTQHLGDGRYVVETYPDVLSMLGSYLTGIKGEEKWLRLGKACRDTNPMLLHTALVQMIAKGQGFVMDVDRHSQVWNQPVYAFKSQFVKLTLKNGERAKDNLVSIKDLADPLSAHRARGTEYLASVATTVEYGLENGPFLTYAKNGADESYSTALFRYTLEFDADKKLIGGEWENDPDFFGEIPDFLWFYPPGLKPVQSKNGLNIALIQKLHDCSLQPATHTMKFTKADGETEEQIELPYSLCEI